MVRLKGAPVIDKDRVLLRKCGIWGLECGVLWGEVGGWITVGKDCGRWSGDRERWLGIGEFCVNEYNMGFNWGFSDMWKSMWKTFLEGRMWWEIAVGIGVWKSFGGFWVEKLVKGRVFGVYFAVSF